ncbi:hypothetical protein Dimus_033406 [Dionaea muscipula]
MRLVFDEAEDPGLRMKIEEENSEPRNFVGNSDCARNLIQMKIEEEMDEPGSENLEREEENAYPGRRRWSGGDGGTASSPVSFVVADGLVEELELGEKSDGDGRCRTMDAITTMDPCHGRRPATAMDADLLLPWTLTCCCQVRRPAAAMDVD